MRWIYCFICAALGVALFACGLHVPAHLRAVDASVLKKAGRDKGLVAQGLALAHDKKLGAAQLLSKAARTESLPDQQQLALAVEELARENPELQFWGSPEPRLQTLFGTAIGSPPPSDRSEEHTSELQSHSFISYAVF